LASTGCMYLSTVLTDIRKDAAPPKQLHAEHLYKLNEAVFNLPEEDSVDQQLAAKLFQTIKKVRQSFNSGQYSNQDKNFFYDYLALLGTVQNQHYFSQTQTWKMLEWIREVVDEECGGPSYTHMEQQVKELESENVRLRIKIQKYEELEAAMYAINHNVGKGRGKGGGGPKGGQGRVMNDDDDEGKFGKDRGKGRADYELAASKGQQKGTRGKGSQGSMHSLPKGHQKGQKRGKDSGERPGGRPVRTDSEGSELMGRHGAAGGRTRGGKGRPSTGMDETAENDDDSVDSRPMKPLRRSKPKNRKSQPKPPMTEATRGGSEDEPRHWKAKDSEGSAP